MTEPASGPGHPIALLVNPASTAAHPGLAEMAERLLTPLGLCVVLTTRERGHAADLAREACTQHGALTVVTMGGDGTAAEAAGALIDTGATLAPIPAGSTNVFARTLGWPNGCEEALRLLARLLREGHQGEEMTIGRLVADGEERFFIVNAGAGIDAEATETVERHPRMKKRVGQLWFAGAIAVAAVRTRRSNGVHARIDDGAPFRLSSLNVACTRPYAYFGRRAFDLIPDAGHEGVIGWVGGTSRSLAGPAVAALGAFTGGWHLNSGLLAHGVSSVRIELESAEGVALQADGEPLGRFRHVIFEPATGLRVMRAA